MDDEVKEQEQLGHYFRRHQADVGRPEPRITLPLLGAMRRPGAVS